VYQQVADVLVLLDGSASVKAHEFKQVKDFVKSLVDSYKIAENGVRFAVVEYSDKAKVVIPLNRFYDANQLKTEIDNIQASGGTSRISKALETALREGFSLENGARPAAPKTLILITDGKSAGDTSLEDAVFPLKQSGVVVHVVAIGNAAKDPDVTSVAAGGDYVQSVDKSDDITSIVPGLVKMINENLDRGKCILGFSKTFCYLIYLY
jgi:Mg-chelatase subunit ChlD